jgi:hypothetical protein
MPGLEGLAFTAAAGQQLHDPGTTRTDRLDVFRRLLGPQGPGDLAAVADLVMCAAKGIWRFPSN